ncbi:hypothetical protein BGZ75_009907, partial [Mortierella antarctica]
LSTRRNLHMRFLRLYLCLISGSTRLKGFGTKTFWLMSRQLRTSARDFGRPCAKVTRRGLFRKN